MGMGTYLWKVLQVKFKSLNIVALRTMAKPHYRRLRTMAKPHCCFQWNCAQQIS